MRKFLKFLGWTFVVLVTLLVANYFRHQYVLKQEAKVDRARVERVLAQQIDELLRELSELERPIKKAVERRQGIAQGSCTQDIDLGTASLAAMQYERHGKIESFNSLHFNGKNEQLLAASSRMTNLIVRLREIQQLNRGLCK